MESTYIPEKMRIYEAGRAVPDYAQKGFNNGRFKGTDISPMWRIKKLTKLFGPCGIGWYTEVIKRETLEVGEEIFAIVDINLYIKDGDGWSKPIFGTGGNALRSKTKNGVMTSDEGFKMAYTDAISVACKALGIGADIYFSADKSSKYAPFYDGDKEPEAPKADEPPALITPAQVAAIKMKCSESEINMLLVRYKIKELCQMTEATAAGVIRNLEARGR